MIQNSPFLKRRRHIRCRRSYLHSCGNDGFRNRVLDQRRRVNWKAIRRAIAQRLDETTDRARSGE
jgi:hypothetical protein